MPIADSPDRAAILAALDRVRAFLALDGGDVRLEDLGDGEVRLAITGACRHCPNLTMTFRYGIAAELRPILPIGTRIHANGMTWAG